MTEPKTLPYKELDGISAKALAIHHDKLYAGYVKKLDEIVERLIALRTSGAYEGNATYSELRALKDAETFATNGVYLHEWYFDALGGDGAYEKAPGLSKALAEKWGSVEEGITYFSACAMAARGWSVLAWDTKAHALLHYNGDAHNQGGVWGCLPIIVIDVYEHAYFIDFGSDRKAYLEAFWKNFDWAKAEELYLKARAVPL
ncbi:MAG TPA: Fe-Mn family superoxide dismutase [Candidatus Paceibacterota bacterium]|nr:Fe-Mn family superoxide dismutase [Candidatus Paceibacterota bacterium]